MAYTGKNWDIATFDATPANVAELERDAEQLFSSVQEVYPVSDSWKNWIGFFAFNHVTALLSNNTVLKNSARLGFLQLRHSSSWKLRVLSMVIWSAEFAAMSPLGGPGKTFLDAVKECGIESPRTAAEKRYFDLAATASDIINWALEKDARKALGIG